MNELDKRIEKYLNGEMEEIEILSFEEEILADKNLKESIEFKKDLIAFFESRNSKLNENLESLGNDFFKDEKATGLFLNNKLIALGLIILMLFIGTSYYMFFLGKDNKEDVRKEQVEDSSEIDILIEKEIIQEIIQEETNEEEENLLPTFKPSKVLEKPIDTNQQPIASTDNFIQNPNLELLIRENVRSKNVEFTLINKPDNQTLSLFDGSANLKISGSMNIDDTIEYVFKCL